MKKILLIILVLAALVFVGFYFKDNLTGFYSILGQKIDQFKKTDLGVIIDQISQEIFAPPPLRFLSPDKNVVLYADKVMVETNLQRQLNQLPALKENSVLKEAALAKANDMFKNQYFEHVSPAGVGPGELVTKYGYNYLVAGENLILGNFSSEKEMVDKWMASPGHRANILYKRYTEIGVSVVKGEYNGQSVWIGVQEFGLPASVCPKPSVSLRDQINSDKIQMDQLSSLISQKKSDIANSTPGSSEYSNNVKQYNDLVGEYNYLVEKTKSLISEYNNEIYIFNNCVK